MEAGSGKAEPVGEHVLGEFVRTSENLCAILTPLNQIKIEIVGLHIRL